MHPDAEFRRRRLVFMTALVGCIGLSLVSILAWNSDRLDARIASILTAAGTAGVVIWSFIGTNWVMRARTGSANPAQKTDDARRRRRIYLVAILPAGMFLWRRLDEFVSSSGGSRGDVIFTPLLSIAGALIFWWVWAEGMWRFTRIVRASQK